MSKKILLKRLFLAALLLQLCGASVADWIQVGRSVEATISYDKETVRKSDAGVKLWVLTNFASMELLEGKSYQSAKTHFEYDCIGERYRVVATIFYELPNGTGKVKNFW